MLHPRSIEVLRALMICLMGLSDTNAFMIMILMIVLKHTIIKSLAFNTHQVVKKKTVQRVRLGLYLNSID